MDDYQYLPQSSGVRKLGLRKISGLQFQKTSDRGVLYFRVSLGQPKLCVPGSGGWRYLTLDGEGQVQCVPWRPLPEAKVSGILFGFVHLRCEIEVVWINSHAVLIAGGGIVVGSSRTLCALYRKVTFPLGRRSVKIVECAEVPPLLVALRDGLETVLNMSPAAKWQWLLVREVDVFGAPVRQTCD